MTPWNDGRWSPSRLLEPRVTVCIAAGCGEKEGTPAVVMCSDWKLSTALGSSETSFKSKRLSSAFWCLTAGPDDEIDTVVRALRAEFNSLETEDETTVLPAVQNALRRRKRQKVEDFVFGKYAIGYDELKASGKAHFPDDLFRDAMSDISKIEIDGRFIVAGFDQNGMQLIVETYPDATAKIKQDFAVVGSGELLAMASIMSRSQNDTMPIDLTLYHVYEAKKYAERYDTVGKFTTIMVLKPGGVTLWVDELGKTLLDRRYLKFGPKSTIGEDFTLPEGFFSLE